MNNPIPPDWHKNHFDALLAYALEKISDRNRAAELVEQTFVTAVASQAVFSSEKALRQWLTAILKNKITDLLSQDSLNP